MTDNSDVTSPRELTALFREHNLSPNIRYGQNFLIDANIVRKIADAVGVNPGDQVVEIGPGAGALTLALAHRGAKLVALEIDRGLARLLHKLTNSYEGVLIKHGDALKMDWQQLIEEHFDINAPVKLVSNLPYNISGPFMFELFKCGFPFERAVLMFQKEVARRLVARPGAPDYGSLSVICAYYSTGKVLFDVSCNVFWPRPKIDSSVVLLKPDRRLLPVEMEPLFWELVKGVFRQRRKTILKSLKSTFDFPREELALLLQEAGVSPAARPEELAPSQFAKLAGIAYNVFSQSR